MAMEYHTFHPLTEENPHYLHVRTMRPGCGFTNKAYDGIFLTKGETYHISFYMNTLAYVGGVKVLVEKDQDAFLEGEIVITEAAEGWKKYELDFAEK